MTSLLTLFSPAARKQARRADALYRGLMAAALAPDLFTGGLVADDMDHRVQMVAVHAALLAWQLPLRPEPDLRRLPEGIHARVFDGFDAALRETGVGDASIARKVRKLGEHYYGLGAAVADTLSGAPEGWEPDLTEVFVRNGVTAAGRESELAAHVAALAEAFEASPSDIYLAGDAPWQAFPATRRRGVAKG
ncbi:MAG: ubiquinol-cytochrome C chaperone family protein [Hyphomonas sp.]|nr:ubiquinol-cytochrome C chaperone family protein [Hyphomonas sp.]